MAGTDERGPSQAYNNSFYAYLGRTEYDGPIDEAARLLLGLLPGTRSCVDVGCGLGAWLAGLGRLGIANVLGIDGPWVPGERLLIPQGAFMEWDISSSWPAVGRRFDLALCLEVGEHLPPDKADGLVQFLSSLSDAVAFSAAVPDQGGTNHINEQWPEYWAGKFRANGYVALDAARGGLMGVNGLPWWYKQNMFVAVRREALGIVNRQGLGENIPGLIHPDSCRPALALMRLLRRTPLGPALRALRDAYAKITGPTKAHGLEGHQ